MECACTEEVDVGSYVASVTEGACDVEASVEWVADSGTFGAVPALSECHARDVGNVLVDGWVWPAAFHDVSDVVLAVWPVDPSSRQLLPVLRVRAVSVEFLNVVVSRVSVFVVSCNSMVVGGE